MRTCTKCGSEKSEDEFAWKNKSSGKRVSQCKACHRAYSKVHYKNNLQKYKDKSAARRPLGLLKHKTRIAKYLADHPCVDCGETDIDVLEFDHMELVGSKARRVTSFISSGWNAIEAEIAKCEVRCCNCHQRRTRMQLNRGSRWDLLKMDT